MARVLTIIEESCSFSLSRKAKADEVLLNIDALSPKCFHSVNKFVHNCLLNRATSSRIKSKGKLISESELTKKIKSNN